MEYHHGLYVDIVEESAKSYPNNIAYTFMDQAVSYPDFVAQINKTARALTALGIGEDDVISVCMPNMPQAIIMFYAVNKIGAVVNMIHPLSTEKEILDDINMLNSKAIMILDAMYANVPGIVNATSLEHLIICSAGDVLPPLLKLGYQLTQGRKIKKPANNLKHITWPELQKKSQSETVIPTISDRTDKAALILFSGGTTGKTKAVSISNLSINASATQMIATTSTFTDGVSFLTVMPIFHGNGLIIGVHAVMMAGAKSILIPRFTPESYVKDMLKYKASFISGAPTLFERMLDVEDLKSADLSFIKGMFSGADALSAELEHKINAFLADHGCKIHVRQGYGMTEGVVASCLVPEGDFKEGSIGKPLNDVVMKIVEPGTDNELPIGEVGEIVFSSVTNMIEYINEPEETAMTMRKHSDGLTYIHSGDLGCVDEEGFFYFKGRIKRMIVTNGYNVFPLEMEEIIEQNEMVKRCCIVGVPDPKRIEKVKAFIVLNPGYDKSDETKDKLNEYFAKNIARYAKPREIEFIDELPKTKIGKVDYNALKNKH